MKIRMWKIFYDGGGTFSNRDGSPQEAPARGVQVIIQSSDRVGRAVVRSSDYYIFSARCGGWEGVDIFGLWDYLASPGFKVVKFGRTIGNQEWNDVLIRAVDDPELPRKSNWFPHERKSVK